MREMYSTASVRKQINFLLPGRKINWLVFAYFLYFEQCLKLWKKDPAPPTCVSHLYKPIGDLDFFFFSISSLKVLLLLDTIEIFGIVLINMYQLTHMQTIDSETRECSIEHIWDILHICSHNHVPINWV